MKLNVIFIGSFLYPNGYAATKRKQQFIDYIISKGDYARVLLTVKLASGHEINSPKGVHNGVPYEVIAPHLKPNIFFPISFIALLFKSFFWLRKFRRKDCKNIILSFGINFDTLFPLLFAKFLGYRVVFDIVEDFSTLKRNKSVFSKVKYTFTDTIPEGFLLFLSDGFSVISSYLADIYMRKNVKVPVVIVPVSAQNLLFDNKVHPKNKDNFKLLYSGTYGVKEGLSTLIDAFSTIIHDNNNIFLVMTGNCPQKVKDLILTIIGSYDNIIFTGRLSDEEYYRVLAEADVMLMTRTNSAFANAGFPYKLGEYLATGNPVVCTNVSDISLYLKNDYSAIIIPPDNKEALVNAIKKLYEDPKLRLSIGRNGKEVCEKHFNPSSNSSILYHLLKIA